MTPQSSNPQPRRIVFDIAAGGVVFRYCGAQLQVCLIRRARFRSGLRERPGTDSVWGLPKGHAEPAEQLAATALREVKEETGLVAQLLKPVTTIRYWFREPGDPSLHAKTVHFFLMRAQRGRLEDHDREVIEARWMSWAAAMDAVAYENERQVLRLARQLIE